MNTSLAQKLKNLPNSPGVYFHKSTSGEVIYVGKAAVLKNRVRQYFQANRDIDAKTRALVAEIEDTDWIETDSEIDALFLESEMVKRYMPRYNILLRDDKSQLYVRIDIKSEWPHVSFTRNPADDKARYIGPFYNGHALKKALRYLRKVFPYYTKPPGTHRVDFDVHLGLSPRSDMTSQEYKSSLKKLIRYIEGDKLTITRELERDMNRAARQQQFEIAAELRNRLGYLRELQRRIMFGDKEFLDISKDRALDDLRLLLGLASIPARVEGYDISHMSGTNVVASMVVFTNGVSDRTEYRKFKMHKEQNNDFANMFETLSRRFSEKNRSRWKLPDICLIDGGKGQLDSAITARDQAGLTIPMIGLAKQHEEIVVHLERSRVRLDHKVLERLDGHTMTSDKFTLISLPHSSHIVKLLQRIRDESHRFAVTYHTTLKRTSQTKSTLEDIPGIGPVTRKKLIKAFGSLRGIEQASQTDITQVVGDKLAQRIISFVKS
ncbi:putative excinuclease ABC, C subunit domain protein [Candidatus Saccharimonas aalborgensis]|jgi:excinuclease ABC subunit C|uniref:Putative excinuclease ABC, C subunit domain protein n=1 Tax=Candidatus Saccharimonas aalborgensis TaxID=1332188 RepID=R4PM37_9BACT|nr:excinuclease ABC subunit UvrC [Candidatus Saccharimonas aalborgensis]MBP7775012.1 excinuclease ABC subunit UvrC [Candidatus Saccharimonas sp.]QQR51729.1 MAG: excinuclease ABC subunit UvrC [Candidatus Saccharibacteria bacterium]AGL61929.1 putative excinuclease ABC, C subunit domain protein [Candidatus Saccharimonas aalborgensis]QQS68460.1 MAG: excinuclease ABC subunit UvrC [Candidatus Saccharibacteria bacterium]QQS70751.1 MAG: excinuclease ABC subunit UvrC [Candidatus Saccharibacteria bacter